MITRTTRRPCRDDRIRQPSAVSRQPSACRPVEQPFAQERETPDDEGDQRAGGEGGRGPGDVEERGGGEPGGPVAGPGRGVQDGEDCGPGPREEALRQGEVADDQQRAVEQVSRRTVAVPGRCRVPTPPAVPVHAPVCGIRRADNSGEADTAAWRQVLARIPLPEGPRQTADLVRLRDDPRADVEERGTSRLDAWLTAHPQTARIENGALVLRGAAAPVDELLRIAVELVRDGRRRRLRACPDRRWVFHDQSRNTARTGAACTRATRAAPAAASPR
ncbi:hypothetical protein ACPCJU_07890 [Streptomyces thermodiastaticus]